MNINSVHSNMDEYQKPVSYEQTSDVSFEALLCPPTGKFTGSEYNWVHLENMKSSELSFKSEAIKNKESYTRKNESETVLHKESFSAESVENSYRLEPFHEKPQILAKIVSALGNRAGMKIEKLFKHLTTEINALADIKNMRDDRSSFNTVTKAARFSKLTCQNENSVQSYQMHRNKNEVELSMLIEDMSDSQLLKLKSLIVQLLHKKGLHLRTFKINGVLL